jgi:hypothetical protein
VSFHSPRWRRYGPGWRRLAVSLTRWSADDSLWPSFANGRGLTSGTFYTNLRRHLKKAGLPLSGVHVFRHSAAKLRRDAGESIEEVSSTY